MSDIDKTRYDAVTRDIPNKNRGKFRWEKEQKQLEYDKPFEQTDYPVISNKIFDYKAIGWDKNAINNVIDSDYNKVYQEYDRATYTVNFDTNEGHPIVGTQYVDKNNKVQQPIINLFKEGYQFVNWVDANQRVWDFNTDVVNSDMILYATYQPIQYTVRFMGADNSTVLASFTKNYGEQLTQTEIDYVNNLPKQQWFTYWCDNIIDENGFKWNENEKIYKNYTYYQVIKPEYVTITYHQYKNSNITQQYTVEKGSAHTIKKLIDFPQSWQNREGYTYSNSLNINSYQTYAEGDVIYINYDMDIWFNWSVNVFTITVSVFNGGNNGYIIANYGDNIKQKITNWCSGLTEEEKRNLNSDFVYYNYDKINYYSSQPQTETEVGVNDVITGDTHCHLTRGNRVANNIHIYVYYRRGNVAKGFLSKSYSYVSKQALLGVNENINDLYNVFNDKSNIINTQVEAYGIESPLDFNIQQANYYYDNTENGTMSSGHTKLSIRYDYPEVQLATKDGYNILKFNSSVLSNLENGDTRLYNTNGNNIKCITQIGKRTNSTNSLNIDYSKLSQAEKNYLQNNSDAAIIITIDYDNKN